MEQNIRHPLPKGFRLYLQLTNGGEEIYRIQEIIGYGGSCIVYRGQRCDKSGNVSEGFSRSQIIKEFFPASLHGIQREGADLNIPSGWEADFLERKKHFLQGAIRFEECYEIDDQHTLSRPFYYGEAHKTVYAISDPSCGEILRDSNREQLSLYSIAEIMYSLCRTAQKYHEKDLLYLDFKPDNIYMRKIDMSYHIALFDFDTVLSLRDLQGKSNYYITYSEGWAPPEQKQWNFHEINKTADIYALGAIFFWLLTGRKPTADRDNLLMKSDIDVIREEKFDLKSEAPLCQPVGEEVLGVIHRILKKSLSYLREYRYQEVDLLIQDYQQLKDLTQSREENVTLYEQGKETKNLIERIHGKEEERYEELQSSMEKMHTKFKEVLTFTQIIQSSRSVAEPTESFKDGNYEGETSHGVRHGKGIQRYYDGSWYDGEWIFDKRQGKGIYTNVNDKSNGGHYDGEWFQDRKEGQGIQTYYDGSQYNGFWRKGKRNGKGIMTWSDGAEYNGEWKDDKFHGQGRYTFADGGRYEGSWKTGKRSGKGIMTWPDGAEYEGEFEENKPHGQGKYTWIDKERNNNFLQDNINQKTNEVLEEGKRTIEGVVNKNEFFIIELKVRKLGDKIWLHQIEIEPGSEVEFQLMYKNTGEETQKDVIAKVFLSHEIVPRENSLLLKNAIYPESVKISNQESLFNKRGLNLGAYAPKSNVYLKFQAKVYESEKLGPLGKKMKYIFKNRLIIYIHTGNLEDIASVVVETIPWKFGKKHEQKINDHNERYNYEGSWMNGKKSGYGIVNYLDGTKYLGYWTDNRKKGTGTIIWLDGEKYEGEWKEDQPNGRGKYSFIDGGIYEGFWVNGKMHGLGILTMPHGVIYKGFWIGGGKQGHGILIWPDGSRYEGEFKENRYHGQGKMNYADGNRYEGEYKEGQRNGQGIYIWSDGSRYEGFWANDKRAGQGIYIRSDGSRYEGEFKEGRYHGQGKMNYADGSRYEGSWDNDKRAGQGIYIGSDGSRYEGEFKEDQRNGQGIYIGSDGGRYEGEFKENRYHGQGKMNYADGSRYEGSWANGKRAGQGIYIGSDGSRYEGEWKDNKYHGFGKKTNRLGELYIGEWNAGCYQGLGIHIDLSGLLREGIWTDGKFVQKRDLTSGDFWNNKFWESHMRNFRAKDLVRVAEKYLETRYGQETRETKALQILRDIYAAEKDESAGKLLVITLKIKAKGLKQEEKGNPDLSYAKLRQAEELEKEVEDIRRNLKNAEFIFMQVAFTLSGLEKFKPVYGCIHNPRVMEKMVYQLTEFLPKGKINEAEDFLFGSLNMIEEKEKKTPQDSGEFLDDLEILSATFYNWLESQGDQWLKKHNFSMAEALVGKKDFKRKVEKLRYLIGNP